MTDATRYGVDVVSALVQRATSAPLAPAILDGDGATDQSTLAATALDIAERLRASGVCEGDVVGLCLPRGRTTVAHILGVLAAGAGWTVLDPASPPARTAAILDAADIRLVVSDDVTFTRTDHAVMMIEPVAPADGQHLARLVARWEPGHADGDSVAYVIATSGTTGVPKAVQVPRRALEHFVAAAATTYRMSASDRILHVSSLSFDTSVEELMMPLAVGAAIVVGDKDLLSSPDLLLEHCARHGVTVLDLTTAYWVDLVAALERDGSGFPPGVRAVIVGGESMPASAVARWHRIDADRTIALFNTYGPTETTVVATAADLTEWTGQDPVPIGHPLPGILCRAVDDDGNDSVTGQPGELLVGGPGVSAGYMGMPEATAARFSTDEDEVRWFRTGDRVVMTGDGWAHLGRLDRQVKIRGFRVEPGEIETALRSVDGVADAVVVVDAKGRRPRLVAHALGAANGEITPEGLRQALAASVPEWSMPSAIMCHDSFPLTVQGKIDRAALASVLPHAPAPDDSATDAVSARVAALWHAALQVADLPSDAVPVPAPDADFFSAGGDSLDAIRLISSVRREFGLDLLLTTFIASPSFSALVDALRDADQLMTTATVSEPACPPTAATGRYALSSLQRHFWVTEQLASDQAPQNLGIRFLWAGALDVATLSTALAAVARSHPALGSSVRTDEQGEPFLDSTGPRPITVTQHTIDADPAAADLVRRALHAEPFDLERAPLARAHVLRGDETEELLLVVSHLVFDGWSVGVFADALGAAYDDATRDGDDHSSLSVVPPPVPAHLTASRRTVLTEYWADRLRAVELDHAVPADRPWVTRPVSPADRVVLQVPLSDVDGWRDAAKIARVTPFAVVMSAISTLAFRSGGGDDVVVLASAAGRHDAALHDVIGAALTVVPIRTTMAPTDTFADLARRAHAHLGADLAHSDLDLGSIAAAAGLRSFEGPDGRGPIVVSMHNTPAPTTDRLTYLGDLPPVATANHLTIGIETHFTGARLLLDYATDIYDRERVEAFAGHLLTILDAGAADPATVIGDLPLMPATELEQVLRGWNESDVVTARFGTVNEYFEHVVAEMPDAPALTSSDTTVTYRELDERANRIARLLRHRGVSPGDRVAICLPRDIELFAAMWGVLKAGAAYVPLDPEYPADRLEYMLSDSGARIMLTDTSATWSTARDGNAETLVLDEEAVSAELRAAPASPPDAAHSTHDPAYVMYTSGSTGQPKGVVIGHDNLSHAIDMWQRAYALEAGMVYQQQASFSFDMFVCETFRAMGTGGRVVVVPRAVTLDPARLVELMQTERVQVTEVVPALLRAIVGHLEATNTRLPHLKLFICGGEKWGVNDYRRAQQVIAEDGRVINAYGVTEGTADSAYFDGDVDDLSDDAPLPIGHPFPGCRMYVLDARLRPVPAGVTGELYLAGPGIGHGYLERPELTAQRFMAEHLVRGDAPADARMYRTGDASQYRRDGAIEFLGRLDDQVKVNGHRIELAEVEAALATVDGVADSAATTRPDPGGSNRLIGYIVPPPGVAAPSPSAVRDAVAALLPAHMVPARIVILSSLPLAPSGKIDRRLLPDAPTATETTSAATTTATEREVALIWREVLGVEVVGADDDFFGLGGDSFQALRAVQRLDPQPTLVEFFQRPTVRGVAMLLEQRRDDRHSAASGSTTHRRLHRLTPHRADRTANGVTVVAVPYSGGSAVAYRPLAAALPASWALEAVELPGHDLARPDEPLASISDVADDVVAEMGRIDGPVMLYGHCLSVGLTVAVAQRAEIAGIELVGVALGAGFPTARPAGPLLDLWYRIAPPEKFTADRIYLEYLRGRGGFSDIDDPDDQRFILRALRHDEHGAEEWFTDMYRGTAPEPLRAPVLSVIGQRDRVTDHYTERKDEWQHFARSVHQVVLPDAGHFFLASHADGLAEALVGHAAAHVTVADTPPGPAAAPSAPARPGPTPSLRRFGLLASGQLLSMMGSALSSFVLGLWVLDRTGSITQFAVISAIGLLPGIVLGPIAGVVVDRFDRRLVMLVSDLVAGLSLGVIVLSIALSDDGPGLTLICVAVSISSLASAFQRPAFLAAVTQLVPKRYLGHTAGMTQLGVSLGTVIAPMLGVGLYAAGGLAAAVTVDIATFFGGVVTLLVVRLPDRLWQRRDEPFMTELRNGWHYVTRRPGMRAALRFFVIDHALYTIGFAVLVPYMLIEHSTAVLGLAVTAGGVGGLLAALIMSISGGVPHRVRGMLLFMGVSSVGMAVIAVNVPALAIVGMFVMTFGEVLSEAHWIAFIQRKVGFDLQGRVLSIFLTVMMLTAPVGYLVVGPLAEELVQPLLDTDGALAGNVGQLIGVGPGRGLALLVLISGLACLAWAVVGWRSPLLRSLDDDLPDTIPSGMIGDRDAVQRAADEAHGVVTASNAR